ncbi:MAG: hypothetical protein LCH30_01325 [Proteobacteria bacterium]|nr:hypothetical protein [Pseudomonadota bacterium]
MFLPYMSIKFSQLKERKLSTSVKTSHSIKTYTFIDQSGKEQLGFFKAIDPATSYPEFLGYYSVALSIAMRLTLNDRVAEERLVFDDNNQLIGTLSIAIPGFKPLANCSTDAPDDEETNPSLQSIMDNNWIELLVILLAWLEDDAHPDNVGEKGVIDRDMTFYIITRLIKASRVSQVVFTEKTISNFPNPTGSTYHPAIPYSVYYLGFSHRYCHAAKRFSQLAANPDIKDKEGATIHEQMFAAFFKLLLSFDPVVLRARLEQYFDKLPYDLNSLPEPNRLALIKEYPELFDSNYKTFVDHIMVVLEHHYAHLYQTIVNYEGCEQNDYGASVPSFNEFLRKKPSAFKKICNELRAENKKMEESYTPSNIEFIPSVYNMPDEARPNDERLDKKFQEIWRDSFYKRIKKLLVEFDEIINRIDNQPQDLFTKSIAFFSKKSIYKEDLIPFQTRLNIQFDKYFAKDSEVSNEEFLFEFTKDLRALKELKKTNAFGAQEDGFDAVIVGLEKNCEALDFQKYKAKQDDELMRSVVFTVVHNTLEAVEFNINALFSWLGQKESRWFQDKLNSIAEQYAPWCGFYKQTRKEEVTVYAKLEDEKPVSSFAEIICRGGCEPNSFNTLLIKNLFLSMLCTMDTDDPKNQQLKALLIAINNNKFDEKTYLERARVYVANNESLNGKKLVKQINDICYKWINKLDKKSFKAIINEAKTLYAPGFFNNRKRGPEIETLLTEDYLNQDLLAHLLKKGGTKTTSFNTHLFKAILENIKLRTWEKEEEIISDEERQLLACIQDPIPNFILESLKTYAEARLKFSDAPNTNAFVS